MKSTHPDLQREELMTLSSKTVSMGLKSGADEVEVSLSDAREYNVDVRKGNIENLVEAGSRYLSLKVIKEKKTAYAGSSDLSQETLRHLVSNAVRRAELAHPDEFSGLPAASRETFDIPSLNLFDPLVTELDSQKKISLAVETERIALKDRRISNSHGASFTSAVSTFILANSRGFLQGYDQTYCHLSLGLQAGDTNHRAEDYWFSSGLHLHDLEHPESIAKKAVHRTVRHLNSRKVKTQKVPVVLEPMMTNWLLGFIFSCVSGSAVYRKLTFLADKLGEKISVDQLSIVDDGLIPGKLGTRPFDSEGVRSQRTSVIKNGILENYLCDTYAAKKLKRKSTGNADGKAIGSTNFFLQAGKMPPAEIIRSVKKGLVLTRTIGQGLNSLTGDISTGAFGLWVENGEIAYPVSEITVSGNLSEILQNVELIGNDLEMISPISGPTIKIRELFIAGK